MAGGPGSTDTRSAPMRAITDGTSNTGCGIIVAPVIKQARMPALRPKEWKNGLTIR